MKTPSFRLIHVIAIAAILLGGAAFPNAGGGYPLRDSGKALAQPPHLTAASAESPGQGILDEPGASNPFLTMLAARLAPNAKNGHPKLESVLEELASGYQTQGMALALALAEQHNIPQTDGEIRVVIEIAQDKANELLASAGSLGVKEEARHKNLLQVRAPMSSLSQLADLPHVIFVRRPFRAQKTPQVPTADEANAIRLATPLSAVTGEGVRDIGADTWQAAGFRGQGAKIAIIDGGFEGYEALLGVELPASVANRSFRVDRDISGGGDRHGTAVAEIIHEVAPDAELLLVNFDTDVEWGNAVDFMVSQEVDIVSSSVGFLFGPFDGTGFFSETVSAVRDAGILWSQSAGNYASEHWQGTFADPDGNSFQNFVPNAELNVFSVPPNRLIRVILNWDDWPGSDQDYDLFLFQQIAGEWVAVDSSTTTQSGSQPPFEAVIGGSGDGGTFAVGIQRASGTRDVRLDLYTIDFDLQFPVASSSLVLPADSPGATTVGAVRVGQGLLEPFSSHGPTADGRTKPDIAAPDGVTTISFSTQRFFGTSASAPHVAGAAALVKSANPSFGADQIEQFLMQRAIESGQPGRDNLFGSGRLDLGPPGVGPGPAPPVGGVDAKIELVFPHDTAGNPTGVTDGSLVNIGAFLFLSNSLTPVPCNFAQPVRLFRSFNSDLADEVEPGTPRIITRDGKKITVWEFNNIDVSGVADPLNKYYFFLGADGIPTNTNVWSHGEDARTIFPQQDQIAGLGPLGQAVDARIEVVFPHDAQGNPRSVGEADFVNLGIDIFRTGTLVSAPPEADLTVRLFRSLNNDVEEFVGVGQKQITADGGVDHPRWLFNNVEVSASRNPLNKYYFRIAVDGLATRSNTWSHGADARTIFPEQDIPTSSCQ